MHLSTALATLKPLKNHDCLMIQEKLNSGFTIVCASKAGFKTHFKYVFKVRGNLLYCYTLSNSTEEQIVLTLEQVNRMIPGTFNIFYNLYLAKQDFIFEDVEDCFGNVIENNWAMTETEILKMMKDQDVVQFRK